jgi:endonuclease YncB( thermonuclease family)
MDFLNQILAGFLAKFKAASPTLYIVIATLITGAVYFVNNAANFGITLPANIINPILWAAALLLGSRTTKFGASASLIAVFLFSSALLPAQTPLPTTAFRATVVGNYDGDNLTVSVGDTAPQILKLRLAAIDAPERLKKPIIRKEQPGAEQSRLALAGLLPKGTVVLIDSLDERDRYGRIVARVWLNNEEGSTDIAYWQIRGGYAWYVYNSEIPKASRQLFAAAFKVAKLEKRGIWDDAVYVKEPVSPGTWKKRYGTTTIFRRVFSPS